MNHNLHDYEIDSVVLDGDRIIFSFPEGFYVEDDGRETMMGKLVFIIDRTCCSDTPLDSFLFIRRHLPLGWRDISFRQFTALFKKGNMLIHDEYDSKMTNWKMIQLNANTRWSNIELFITDIEKIEYWER